MIYTIIGTVKVTAEHTQGMTSSRHITTDFRLDVSKNLKQDEYNDKSGLPTKSGSHALTNAFVQGLIGNIHHAHEKGFKDSAEHLRYIIDQLEKGFISVANISEGTM